MLPSLICIKAKKDIIPIDQNSVYKGGPFKKVTIKKKTKKNYQIPSPHPPYISYHIISKK